MVDKIAKLLAKLPKNDLVRLMAVVNKIVLSDYNDLDIKVLKGNKNIFRVRVGNYRIIFSVISKKKTEIISVAKRNEKTYKDL